MPQAGDYTTDLVNEGTNNLYFTNARAQGAIANFTGDSGAGGTRGTVPAPAAGDAAAGKFLKANGQWTLPSAGASRDNSLDLPSGGCDMGRSGPYPDWGILYNPNGTGVFSWCAAHAGAFLYYDLTDGTLARIVRWPRNIDFTKPVSLVVGFASAAGGGTGNVQFQVQIACVSSGDLPLSDLRCVGPKRHRSDFGGPKRHPRGDDGEYRYGWLQSGRTPCISCYRATRVWRVTAPRPRGFSRPGWTIQVSEWQRRS